MVGWVSPAPRRSTWIIIWSCLSIFIVCSWKCVHLNIPTHEEIQGEWHTVQLFEYLPDVSFWPKAPLRRKWRRKIAWMTFIALASLGWRWLRGTDIQPDMLRIPEPEIKDLSKADVITKAFAIIQCTWLVVQSISRFAHGYAIYQLELATLAFIFCAFVMHVFWWNKPFNVESRRIVTAIGPDIKVPANLSTLSMDDFTVSDNALLRERVKDLSDDSLAGILDPLTAIHFNTASASFKEYLPSISLYIAPTAFLAIHLAAWNWDFPPL
ncbi:hypothetical protein Forpe1208_v011702 [Fusarium oxysporum f. sp. rapae]|uniref:Uncharacterized protein n=1 Tax=Fusarium oxysporum f. sp. rapae TaxID=485398 RepID=A0A8J5U3Y0_FUSOX|nr:hypothetical protein Forpe1208_v011702 [Fusarium oxysporum f. sp. rapae]